MSHTYKKTLTTPAPSLETVYHPPGFMQPINRISMPRLTPSFFSDSEMSLFDLPASTKAMIDTNTHKRMAKQLEMERNIAWKQPAFRYKTKLGQFPKEAPAYLYIRRTDPFTKVKKTVPEMVYPILANRIPVPRHEFLEDDWRAYRSALHGMYAMAREQMMPTDRMYEYHKLNDVVGRIIESKCGRQPVHLLGDKKHSKVLAQPTINIYHDCVNSPAGFLYRHYKSGEESHNHQPPQKPEPTTIKKTIFEGPFEYKMTVPEGVQKASDIYWDPDVIAGGPDRRDVLVYNEPEAIPESCVGKDFSVPLSKTVEKIVTGNGRESVRRLWAMVEPPGARGFMIPPQQPQSKLVPLMETDSEQQVSAMPSDSYIRRLHGSI